MSTDDNSDSESMNGFDEDEYEDGGSSHINLVWKVHIVPVTEPLSTVFFYNFSQ